MTITRIEKGARLSQGVRHDDTIYLAGQVADKAGADAKAQTEEILGKIDRLLGQLGSDKSKLLSVTVYLADIRSFDAMNAAWEAWVDKANPPARATVQAKLAATKYLVEIAVIAAA